MILHLVKIYFVWPRLERSFFSARRLFITQHLIIQSGVDTQQQSWSEIISVNRCHHRVTAPPVRFPGRPSGWHSCHGSAWGNVITLRCVTIEILASHTAAMRSLRQVLVPPAGMLRARRRRRWRPASCRCTWTFCQTADGDHGLASCSGTSSINVKENCD